MHSQFTPKQLTCDEANCRLIKSCNRTITMMWACRQRRYKSLPAMMIHANPGLLEIRDDQDFGIPGILAVPCRCCNLFISTCTHPAITTHCVSSDRLNRNKSPCILIYRLAHTDKSTFSKVKIYLYNAQVVHEFL